MGRKAFLSEGQQQQVLAWSKQGVPQAEQARRLGVLRSHVSGIYRRYLKQGLITKAAPDRNRTWKPRDVARLKRLIDEGYGYEAIAQHMGRSPDGVEWAVRIHGYRLYESTKLLTAKEAGRLLGFTSGSAIVRWIRMGWVPARNARRASATRAIPIWRIAKEDVYTFLQNEAYWHEWEPEKIANPDMRRWAIDMRKKSPLLTAHEVAQRYYVTASTVREWVHRGYMPAVKNRKLYIREADLADFIPPCMRER